MLPICSRFFIYLKTEKIQIIDRNFKALILIIGQNERARTGAAEEHPSNGKGGRKGKKIPNSCDIKDVVN